MHLIIIGSSGFIGSELLKFYNSDNSIKKITQISSTKIDLTLKKSTKYLNKIYSKDCIILFCAGIKKQLGDNIETYSKNCQIINNFSKSLDTKVKKIIFLSSASVYGESTQRHSKITESTRVKLQSFYGISKYVSELMLTKVCSDNKIMLTILRPPLVYGLGDKSDGYGPTKFINNSIAKKDIELWGDGSEKREFVYIKDLVKIIDKINTSDFKGVLNIVSGESYSFLNIIIILKSKYKLTSKIIYKKRSKKQINVYFSNRNLKKIIKNYKFFSLEKGINDFINEHN